ncbi:FUSC family protein [Streptomyces sp. SP18CS02]|uniref:FUSC family protein n=1 Tax=Streptomyces sp. SP18CS02 TaxID=3002531 RepID=UPI002E7759C4|nr:FUSC family protein [Streptomyces sp. SP18CS02]MEE1752035.1 FUSC family protein [Streptomyces sp. SP18CS02]
MTWLRALGGTARAGVTIERTRLEPLVALRAAAGVATVVGLALWLVSPAYAASAAFGAFSAGTATFQRSWRPRKLIALGAGGSLALSTFLGYLAAGRTVTFVLLLALWAFVAGMSWAVGSTAGIVAAGTVAIMLVTVTLPTSVEQALEHAAVIAFGGVVQAALIVVFPIRRWGAHRDALADAFAAVADYARRLRHDPTAPFDPEAMMQARKAATLTPSQARRRPGFLHGPRGLAERVRPAVAALADPRVGAPAEGPQRDRARALLKATADILDAAARSIRRGTRAQVPPDVLEVLGTAPDDEVLRGPARQAAVQLTRLLHEVLATAHSGDTHARPGAAGEKSDPGLLVRPAMHRLAPVVLRTMRRELHRDSPVFRHAVRLAAVASLGWLLGTVLPLGHGYWAPIASVMVMRPDFHQTYARAVGRFAGTLVGVALATGVVQLAHPDAGLSGALAVLSAGLTYLLMRTGYMASQCFTAAYVVFLLGMGGETWHQTVRDRVTLTLVGGALAMLAYLLFPAWETPRLRDRLADHLAANGMYAAAVIEGFADPGGGHRANVRRQLLASREANAAWDESFGRAKKEPVRHRGLTRGEAEDAEEALRSVGRAAMLLETHLPESGAPPVPGAARFAEALTADTAKAARDVRERRNPDWRRVEEALEEWERADGGEDPVVRRGAELLVSALEDLATAVSRTPLEQDVESSRREREEQAESEEAERREEARRTKDRPRDAG